MERLLLIVWMETTLCIMHVGSMPGPGTFGSSWKWVCPFKHHVHFLEFSSLLLFNALPFGYSLLILFHPLKLTPNCYFLVLLILICIFFSLGVLDMTSFYIFYFRNTLNQICPWILDCCNYTKQQIEINPVLLYLLTWNSLNSYSVSRYSLKIV